MPFMPRPSLITDPITAFGKRRPHYEEKRSILVRNNYESIKSKEEILNRPNQPYVSARDSTRNRVLSEVRRNAAIREGGGSAALVTDKFNMDNVLPRLHNSADVKSPRRRVLFILPSQF